MKQPEVNSRKTTSRFGKQLLGMPDQVVGRPPSAVEPNFAVFVSFFTTNYLRSAFI